MTPDQILLIVCVVLFTGVAAMLDWRFKKIPNLYTVPMFAAGILFHLIVGGINDGWAGIGGGLLFALGGFAIGFGVLFVLWLIGGGGGGDVKFMGALGAWLGPTLTLLVLLLTMLIVVAMSGVVVAIQLMNVGISGTKKKYLAVAQSRKQGRRTKQERAVRRRVLPYAVPAAVSTWITLVVAQFIHIPSLSELFSKT